MVPITDQKMLAQEFNPGAYPQQAQATLLLQFAFAFLLFGALLQPLLDLCGLVASLLVEDAEADAVLKDLSKLRESTCVVSTGRSE